MGKVLTALASESLIASCGMLREADDAEITDADRLVFRDAQERAEQAQARLLRAFSATPAIAPEAFTRELERLEAQRQSALTTVAQLEAQERLSVVNQAAAVLTDREQWRRFWLARLNAVGFEQQRDALEGMAVRVQLSNTEIAIEGRLPVGVRQADGVPPAVHTGVSVVRQRGGCAGGPLRGHALAGAEPRPCVAPSGSAVGRRVVRA